MPQQDSQPVGVELAASLSQVAERSLNIMTDFLKRTQSDDFYTVLDPFVITKTFQQMATRALMDPWLLMQQQLSLWTDWVELLKRSSERLYLNKESEPVALPAPEDKRFKDDHWVQDFVFDFIKQSYLLASRHIQETVAKVPGLDEHTARKLSFYTRQVVGALSPTNFAATNPQVIKATVESGGENLLKGLGHLLADLERGKGRLAIRMTDLEAFKLGENIAATPGKVVFQNEMMQLLHYQPTTEQVFKRPLLIVPPWINKFYILDLKPKNSFIKWALDQGHSVFLISWINPDASYADKGFDDYVLHGTLAAVNAIEAITGETEINALGYCIGGTLLASTRAYMATQEDERLASLTFFTTMLDFSEVGELEVFIDEEQLQLLERHMQSRGYLEGTYMADAFSLLRENDLVWSFVVNNYLLGREPMPFDLLYWNSDSTRMPARMHSFYLRHMYQRNLLRQPGGISLGGRPIDLRQIKVPAYFVSTIEDHIAPWTSTYAGTGLLQGPITFVLGGSGHIAGIINPPAAKKYCYWTNDSLEAEPQAWLSQASRHEGSWWGHWAAWVSSQAPEQVPARKPGDAGLPVLEEAPGSYVKVRIL